MFIQVIIIVLTEFQIINFFNEINIQGFDFTNRFKCSDVHKINYLKNLSINIFELKFYQDQNKWKHKLIPIEISKKNSDRIFDLAIYKNHYVLIKKLYVLFGNHNRKFICRRCLNSYTTENMLILHKPKCKNNDITTTRTSKNHIYFGKNIFTEIHCILGFMQISK